MSDSMRTVLCLIAIAILVAAAQTMDYNEQQQDRAAAPSGNYVAWHNEILRSTRKDMAPQDSGARK